MKINLELLNTILEKQILDYELSVCETEIHYWLPNNKDGFISVYEIAFKCKEWAWECGYEIFSKAEKSKDGYTYGLTNLYKCFGLEMLENFSAKTEPEAIFKACEWVREQNATN